MKGKNEKKVTDIIIKHQKCNNPKVSVIVPVFKVERYLAQCLDSIVNQTLEEIEIIIVDEGLQDRCREIIDFYEKNDPRVIAPHRNNGGYGASCNLGIELAKGEYIAIVESDDCIEPEMYEEMYQYAKQLDADVVKTPYTEYFSDGRKYDCNYRRFMMEVTPSGKCFSMKEFGNLLSVHASLWAAIYKTSYIRKNNIQFIKAKGGAYVDVGFRIDTLIHTDKVAWLNKPYYNYRVDAVGSTTNNFNLSPMILRWTEAHEKFVPIQKDYDEYYGKYLILDEYLNTVGWLKTLKATPKQLEDIHKNLSYVKEETIINSPVLDKNQIKELLMYKNNPKRFLKSVRITKIKNKIKNDFISLMIRIAKPWHLFVALSFLLISLYMEKYFTGFLESFFGVNVKIWLAVIGFYALDLCLYELLYVGIILAKSVLSKFKKK